MLIFPKPICRGVQLLVCGAGLQAPVLLLPHHHIHSRYSKVQFSYYLSLYTSQVQYRTYSTVQYTQYSKVQYRTYSTENSTVLLLPHHHIHSRYSKVQFSYYLITIYIPGTVQNVQYSTVHTVQ